MEIEWLDKTSPIYRENQSAIDKLATRIRERFTSGHVGDQLERTLSKSIIVCEEVVRLATKLEAAGAPLLAMDVKDLQRSIRASMREEIEEKGNGDDKNKHKPNKTTRRGRAQAKNQANKAGVLKALAEIRAGQQKDG